jgi:hypothetical protein
MKWGYPYWFFSHLHHCIQELGIQILHLGISVQISQTMCTDTLWKQVGDWSLGAILTPPLLSRFLWNTTSN